jgi:uncharacterized protein YbbC (DUF1343 family)
MLVGLDSIGRGNPAVQARLGGAKVAVLTHAAAVDHRGRQTLSVLQELGALVQVVFTPEHGLHGYAQAEESVSSEPSLDAGPRFVSLYGTSKASLSPESEHFAGVDVFVIDLVDIGARYYTYVWTALLAARVAADAGVHVLVLDRPNPLGGNPFSIEGRPQDPEYLSFVGLESVPIRHSMTIAELLAFHFNRDDRPLGRDGALSVAKIVGWERSRTASAWGRPFVPPSPNMPTLETAFVYPGACLLEGTNLSEGRGTTTPFQLVGAPFLDGVALAQKLGSTSGAWVRPVQFRPTFEKYAGQVVNGVMIHVTEPFEFRPLRTYLSLIYHAYQLAPDKFEFLTRGYEFETEHPAFDLLTGSARARQLIVEGAPLEELISALCPVDEEWIGRIEATEELVQEIQL